MQKNWYELIVADQQKQAVAHVLQCNEKIAEFGLALTQEDVKTLMQYRAQTLKEERRVEFGNSILPELIMAFCDSQYVEQDSFVRQLTDLQEVFYLYKNESGDLLTDTELITFMRESFDDYCGGSIEHLSDTCLERFARAIRAGYEGYREDGGSGQGLLFSEETHWDHNLYWEALQEMFG